jgi:hypothetical protein
MTNRLHLCTPKIVKIFGRRNLDHDKYPGISFSPQEIPDILGCLSSHMQLCELQVREALTTLLEAVGISTSLDLEEVTRLHSSSI